MRNRILTKLFSGLNGSNLVGLALVLLPGCLNEKSNTPSEPPPDPAPSVSMPSQTSYPLICRTINVPWIAQAQTAAGLSGSHRCGQACALMFAGYFHGTPVNWTQITLGDQFLQRRFPQKPYTSTNGWYTWFGGENPLGQLLGDHYRLNYEWHQSGGTADMLINNIVAGRPVLVGVRISGGNLVGPGTSGVQHWVIAVGWDAISPTDGIINVNDPGTDRGTRRGDHLGFLRSWSTSGYEYAFVS